MIPFVLLIIVALTALSSSVAREHDGSWIGEGGYRNAFGEWCCGSADCLEVDVRIVENGYYLPVYNEIVGQREAQWSPDGRYWRCRRADGTRRCFFAPPQST